MRSNLIRIFVGAAMLSTLSACSGSNSNEITVVDSNGKHTANWKSTHKTVASASSSTCAGCHGSDMTGGISKVSCMSPTTGCHTSNPALTNQASGCVSCHGGITTGPNGNAFPNRNNAHAKHLALKGVTCDVCHKGAGSGTALHANGTPDISFSSATFNAKSGLISYDRGTGKCSAVSCHGGQTTPAWSSTAGLTCTNCHELGSKPVAPDTTPTPQYNSFYSGNKSFNGGISQVNLHELHLKLTDNTTVPPSPIGCTNCHDTGKLNANHFTNLASRTFEAPAASTISGSNTKISIYAPYTETAPSGNCTTSCHIPRNWKN